MLFIAAALGREPTPPIGAAAVPVTAIDGGESAAAAVAVAYAETQLGAPYLWGGTGEGGFDCSGLVQAAYQEAGIQLPRVAQAQYDTGPTVPASQPLEPGDLVFFGTDPTHVDHVGIVVAAGEMIDAPHTGAAVRVEPYGWSDYVGATRPAAERVSRPGSGAGGCVRSARCRAR